MLLMRGRLEAPGCFNLPLIVYKELWSRTIGAVILRKWGTKIMCVYTGRFSNEKST